MAIEQSERKPGWGSLALSILFGLPALSGVLSRAIKHSHWFGDYGAVACAAEKYHQGAPIYDMQLACPGMNATVYVYHPWVAQAFAWVFSYLGRETMLWTYAALFTLAVVGLLWIMIGRKTPPTRAKRAWFGAFLTGSAIYWGNIGAILHGLIGLSAVTLQRRPSVLVIAIAIAAIVKPLFLTFAVVFLMLPLPLWRRFAYGALAGALGAAPSLYLLQFGGETGAQWRALLEHFVYVDRPGDGFLGWLAAFGLPVAGLVPAVGYLAFAGVMALAGLALAERLKLNADDRILLGLSLGVLLIPRLMPQDYFLLGPGLIAITGVIAARGNFGVWLQRALLAICVVALVGNMADLADYSNRLASFLLTLTTLAAAAWTITQARAPAETPLTETVAGER